MSTNVRGDLQEAVRARTDAAAHAAHKLIDRVAERAERSEQKLRESARAAQQTLQGSWRAARSKGLDTKNSIGDFVRRHPVASLGFAVGIGALLASRAKRRALAAANSAATDEAATPMH